MNNIILCPVTPGFTEIRGSLQYPSGRYDFIDRSGKPLQPVYLCTLQFTPTLCINNRNRIFVFGDNTDRTGVGGQACIRNCDNSAGIRTKKFPQRTPSSYFTDKDYLWFQNMVHDDISNLLDLNRSKSIVLSASGYGTGRAELPTRAPKCYKFLCDRLNDFCGTLVFNPNYTPCT